MAEPLQPGIGEKPVNSEVMRRHWRTNVCIMTVLLLVWAFVGLGCGILFADTLNKFRLFGFPLGFWFAQQGSIVVFVLLILVYAILLNRLDRKFLGSQDSSQDADTGETSKDDRA